MREIFGLFEVDWLAVRSSEFRRLVERFAIAHVMCLELGHREVIVDRGFPVTLFVACARCEKLIRRCTPEEESRALIEIVGIAGTIENVTFDAT